MSVVTLQVGQCGNQVSIPYPNTPGRPQSTDCTVPFPVQLKAKGLCMSREWEYRYLVRRNPGSSCAPALVLRFGCAQVGSAMFSTMWDTVAKGPGRDPADLDIFFREEDRAQGPTHCARAVLMDMEAKVHVPTVPLCSLAFAAVPSCPCPTGHTPPTCVAAALPSHGIRVATSHGSGWDLPC